MLGGGCAGGERDSGSKAPAGPQPAASAKAFAQRFAALTGVRLSPSPDDLVGQRLEVPGEPNRFARLGTYSLVWTRSPSHRKEALRGARGPRRLGVRWRRSGSTWSAVKTYGRHLVLDWSAGTERRTGPQFNRLERAVRAAYLGRPGLLPRPERPCDGNPLSEPAGACSVRGVPVTVARGDTPLDTPAFEAEVGRVQVKAELKPELLPPERARGRFVIVTYQLRTKTLIRSLTPQLRIGRRSFDEAAASVFLPRSRLFPLPPGALYRGSAAFDVPAESAGEARVKGAFVLPAEIDELGDPSADLAQGWIALAR